jgi:hypothetical protein
VKLERRHALWILALAAWNVFIWLTFAKNLYQAHADGEDRATGYWVAHTVLIVVNLLVAAALVRFGTRIWRATRARASVDA